ncbi:MAG: hypothetical protein M3322_04970 [Actinomycetota bacterium]|nr:hypothetical protein [Actinomycetota bacterium]
MAEAAEIDYQVTCPHCSKRFTTPALVDDSGRPRGFKCPHCRLFVPFERVDSTPQH